MRAYDDQVGAAFFRLCHDHSVHAAYVVFNQDAFYCNPSPACLCFGFCEYLFPVVAEGSKQAFATCCTHAQALGNDADINHMQNK